MDEALSTVWYGMAWHGVCGRRFFFQSPLVPIRMLTMFAPRLIQFWLVLFILLSHRRLYAMVFLVFFCVRACVRSFLLHSNTERCS